MSSPIVFWPGGRAPSANANTFWHILGAAGRIQDLKGRGDLVTEVFHAVGPGTEAFCNALNTRGDLRGDDRSRRRSLWPIACSEYTRRRDDRLVYLLQAIGCLHYANEHQSQHNVWRGYMYCVITYYAIVDVTLFMLEMESDDDDVNTNLWN